MDEEYKAWIAGLVEQFRQGQVKAVIHVNRELLLFYWCLGRDINEMDMEHKYGKGIIRTISKDLQRKLPHIKGLTEKNIYYCKRWYSLYNNEFQKFPQPVGKSDGNEFPKVIAEFFSIPWTHHRYILGQQYGNEDAAGVSPTEREYLQATENHRYRIAFIKRATDRHPKQQAFIEQVQSQPIRYWHILSILQAISTDWEPAPTTS